MAYFNKITDPSVDFQAGQDISLESFNYSIETVDLAEKINFET